MQGTARVHTLLLIAILILSACGGGGGGPTGPAPVATIVISPGTPSVQVGSATQLSAETRAANGSVLTGRTVTWSSGNNSIAMVSNGSVQGVAVGSTSITAASEGRSASVNVTVTAPPVVAVQVTPNPASTTVGLTVQLTATARDAGGNVIAGKVFNWTTANANIVTVDQTGLARGVVAGAGMVSATVDNVTGSTTVNVLPGAAVMITQITPATLVEGQPATITGSGFSATPAANAVMIDDVPAVVSQATTTSLQIVVPTFNCRPRRTAPVRVTVGVQISAPVNHPVSPASFVTLAVGQQLIVQQATDRCLQFDASNDPQRYVVGIQSISEVVATLTAVTVNGTIPSGASMSPPLPAVAVTPEPQRPLSLQERAAVDSWSRHVAVTSAAYERERLMLQQIANRGSPGTNALAAAVPTVPGTVTEGQQLTIRYPNFNGNTCTDFQNLPVRVRKIGPRAIFLEDEANPTLLAQSIFDQASNDFTTIYDIDVDHFGAAGDMDANQRIVIVITKEVNKTTGPPLGFVSHGNIFVVAQCAASNEGEFFYMRSPDLTGQFTAGIYTVETLTRDMPNLLAHEFAHIIQGSRRLAAGGQFMVSWLAEGLATAAQEVVGFQLLGLQNGQNYGANTVYSTLGGDPRAFFSYMGDLLAYFGFNFSAGHAATAPEECSWVGSTVAGGNPGPCSFATRLLYGVPWSVIKYSIDRNLGGAANQKQILRAFSDRVGTPGFNDLEVVLQRPITLLIAEWAPMLYLDDRYPAAGFQLANWNIRNIAAAWPAPPNSELQPRMRAFSGFTDSFNVRAGSGAYYDISGANRPAAAIRFRDAAGSALPNSMVLWVVRVQ